MLCLQILVASAALAEHDDGSGGGNSGGRFVAEDGVDRRAADGALNRQVVDFSTAADKFHWTPQDFEKNFGKQLPDALAGALSKEVREQGIAFVVATLFGTINPTQLKNIVTSAFSMKKEIDGKGTGRTASDNEMSAFLGRVLWAAKIDVGDKPGFEELAKLSPPGDKFGAFRTAYLAEKVNVDRRNEDFANLVEKMKKTTDPEEKKKLMAEMNQKFGNVASFLEGQAKAKEDAVGQQVARDVAQALAFKNGKDHFLDLRGKDNVPFRVALGEDPEKFPEALRQSFDQYEPFKNGGFQQMSFADTPHSGVDGNVFRPPVARPVATAIPTPTPTAIPKGPGEGKGGDGDKSGAGKDGGGSKGGAGKDDGKTPAPANKLDARIDKLLEEKDCLSCHLSGDKKLFDADGKLSPEKRARLIEVLEGKNLKHPGKMEKLVPELRDGLTKQEKTLLTAWAKQHGHDKLDLPPEKTIVKAASNLDEAVKAGSFDKKNLVSTDKLKTAVEGPEKDRPLLIDVGMIGGIPGAQRVGNMEHNADATTPKLFNAVLSAAPGQPVVLYCGCCPTQYCVPLLKSLRALHDAGLHENVQILNLPSGFDADWRDRGFPVSPGT